MRNLRKCDAHESATSAQEKEGHGSLHLQQNVAFIEIFRKQRFNFKNRPRTKGRSRMLFTIISLSPGKKRRECFSDRAKLAKLLDCKFTTADSCNSNRKSPLASKYNHKKYIEINGNS